MAKAASGTIPDAHDAKARGENGIRNPGIPSRKRCQLGVGGNQSFCAAANAIKLTAWGLRPQG